MEGPAGSASAYGRDIKHQTVAVSGIMVGRPKIERYRANMLRLEEIFFGENGFSHWSSDHFVVFLPGQR